MPGLPSRRTVFQLLFGALSARAGLAVVAQDWLCPMDPGVRADKPGKCPRCGMQLVAHVPERIEYPIEITQSPERLLPGKPARLILRVFDPSTRSAATKFDIVHEKLIHLFVVSQNLEFFAHVHPKLQSDGTFVQEIELPYGGEYRLLADFYPSGAVPQLALGTIFVSGSSPAAALSANVSPQRAANLTALLQVEPQAPLAGLETKLTYRLDPAAGLEPYLGAWGHMLVASEDLIDLLHLHPFLGAGTSPLQFNVIFPRPGLYRVWTQFQRLGVVNTACFTLTVKSL